MNFGLSHNEPTILTDEEYFGINEKGYLRLFVGQAKMSDNITNRKFKIRLKGMYKPMYLNYYDLISLNMGIENKIEFQAREEFETWYSNGCK